MPTLSTRAIRRLWIAGAIVALLVVGFSVPWRLNFVRDDIAARVQAATGRSFSIDGDVVWRWWPRRLTAERVRFGNPAWAGRREMFTAQQVDARVQLWPLLHERRLVLPRVEVLKPDVWLETTADGRFNARFDREQKDTRSGVQLGTVELDQGVLRFVEKHRDTDLNVRFDNNTSGAAEQRLATRGNGRWRGLPIEFEGTGDPVLRLRDASRPYALDVAARIGATSFKATGSVTGLTKPTAADLKIRAEGPSLAEWYRITGIGLPETPPYRTSGHVMFDGHVWRYEDFDGRVGHSDASGSVRFELRDKRPLISGTLVSRRLELQDLLPSLGKNPAPDARVHNERKAAVKSSKRPAAKGAARSGGDRVLPRSKFSAEKWNTVDADVRFDGQSIENVGRWPFERLKMHVKLEDGRLTLSPLRFGLAGGELAGSVVIDGSRKPMSARLDVRGTRLRLDRLVPAANNQRMALGSVNAKIALSGRGDSIAEMLGTADGEAQMAMGRGEISNLLLELIDLDAQEALGFLIEGDKPVGVRCALVDVAFKDGTMQTRNVVFDTNDTIIEASGKVNFADEKLDLRVRPVPKDVSFLTLRVPFEIKGHLNAPEISPDKGKLMLRAGGALLLGSVTPLAALVPLLETGPGEDADCKALVARAQKEGVPVRNAPPLEPPGAGRPAKPRNRP